MKMQLCIQAVLPKKSDVYRNFNGYCQNQKYFMLILNVTLRNTSNWAAASLEAAAQRRFHIVAANLANWAIWANWANWANWES